MNGVIQITKYSEMILDIINASQEHLTAEQVFLKMKERSSKVVLATVYNNLNGLCDKGAVKRIPMGSSPDRYDKVVRHDHLMCKCCGKLSDLYLEDLTAEIRDKSGVEFESYDLKLMYVCDECRRNQNQQ